jgi:hypothetical protein
MNSQNSHVWSAVNPRAIQETPPHDQKVDVWYAILQSQASGPMFFENTVDYMILYPFICHLTEDKTACASFQHDSATAHTVHVSMAFNARCVWWPTNFKGRLAIKITWF